jgi:fibronectin type 3 domain-containing protein
MCNLVEVDRGPVRLDLDGKGFEYFIKSFDTLTFRLVPTAVAPHKLKNPKAKRVSDKSIHLFWEPAQGAATYNVYRMHNKKEPACLRTLIAETTQTEFLDKNLDPDQIYHYRVAAVGRENLQGELSNMVEAETMDIYISEPIPVQDVIPVERGPRRVIVTWRSNKETIDNYRVYRNRTAVFTPSKNNLIAVISNPKPYYRQTYIDTDVEPGNTYYYKVIAINQVGKQSKASIAGKIILCDDATQEKRYDCKGKEMLFP